LSSQTVVKWFDLFHIVQENFMWLAMVAMQHKNKGLYYFTPNMQHVPST